MVGQIQIEQGSDYEQGLVTLAESLPDHAFVERDIELASAPWDDHASGWFARAAQSGTARAG